MCIYIYIVNYLEIGFKHLEHQAALGNSVYFKVI